MQVSAAGSMQVLLPIACRERDPKAEVQVCMHCNRLDCPAPLNLLLPLLQAQAAQNAGKGHG
jgi:hypothetical protein